MRLSLRSLKRIILFLQLFKGRKQCITHPKNQMLLTISLPVLRPGRFRGSLIVIKER